MIELSTTMLLSGILISIGVSLVDRAEQFVAQVVLREASVALRLATLILMAVRVVALQVRWLHGLLRMIRLRLVLGSSSTGHRILLRRVVRLVAAIVVIVLLISVVVLIRSRSLAHLIIVALCSSVELERLELTLTVVKEVRLAPLAVFVVLLVLLGEASHVMQLI